MAAAETPPPTGGMGFLGLLRFRRSATAVASFDPAQDDELLVLDALQAHVADRLAALLDLAAPDRISRAVPGFCALSLPNCCGALGYARFGGAAVTAQALVDAEGRFLDVSVGWDPAEAPPEVLPRTKLYTSQSLVLANAPHGELIGGSVPRYFLAPACCPLLPWLVTPYRDAGATDGASKERIFNNVHAQGARLVRSAFGRVRARWQESRGERGAGSAHAEACRPRRGHGE